MAALIFLVVGVFAAIRPAREAVILGLLRANAVHVYPGYEQAVQSATTPDGVQLAWAAVGEGPPVVNVAGWATHLERGFGSPGHNVVVPLLMGERRVVVYDGRGFGLSQRDAHDWSLEARVRDLEAVMDAAGVERADLVGLSTAAPTALAFAALHPERVERLLLYGAGVSYAPDGELMPEADAFMRRVFELLQGVGGDERQIEEFLEATRAIDVAAFAPRVQAPTRMVHVVGDELVPYAEAQRLADLIPNAELVSFEGRNHVPLPGDPAAGKLGETLVEFLNAPRE